MATQVAAAADNDAEAQKKVEEYTYLVDKAHQLFAGLRDLPQTGQKHWQPYFQRTFDVYTKLWKFQQQHRSVLEEQKYFGLKRWEIGEIASKIGQLYYHYYLRTSETNYLQESYIFYDAIRSRGYFKNILEAKSSTLVVRKLRYYARYVIVCLLLNRKDMANQLLVELRQLVEQYSKVFRPTDAREWQMVLQEISTFMRADQPITVLDKPAGVSALSFRLKPSDRSQAPVGDLKLKDVVVVGNQSRQVKFSELTLDMFRVLQCLEYEFGRQDKDGSNTHKYLLFKPQLPSLLVYLASAFNDLPKDGVLMVYIVADGERMDDQSAAGLSMNPGPNDESGSSLMPFDLIPYSRKPMFVVIDSDNSSVFESFEGNEFGAPVVVLMSPELIPPALRDPEQPGGLLTLFLSAPIVGFCSVVGVTKMLHSDVEDADRVLNEYFIA